MKVSVMALVIRDKRDNSVIEIHPVGDMYDNVTVSYSAEYVTPYELKKFVDGWMGFNSEAGKRAEKSLIETGAWTDSQEAKDLSSVGNLLINLESKELEWN